MSNTKVNSTLIQGLGYNPLNEQLSVVFKAAPGTTYNYSGVSRSTWDQMNAASSKGRFFNANIRGKYTATKVAS